MAENQTYYVPEQSKWPIVATVGLGVTLYGDIDAPYGFPNGLNKYTNFRNWPNAMLLLFVMFTGNWESIFRATYWDCEGDEGDWGRECSYRYSAPFYFFSYFLMANAVLANLFVSIILDKFTCETASEEESTNFIEVVHVSTASRSSFTWLATYVIVSCNFAWNIAAWEALMPTPPVLVGSVSTRRNEP